jgi:protein transport protein HofC
VTTGPIEPSTSPESTWDADSVAAQPAVAPSPNAAGLDEPALQLDPAEYRSLSRGKPWRLSHLMYLVAAAAVIFWLGMMAAASAALVALLLMAGIVLAFAGVMSAGVIMARRGSTRQDSLLWVLAIASERRMPLAPAVMAFADQYRGRAFARIMDLAAQLNWGTILPEALERSPKLVSRDATLLAWVGQAAGKLPQALRLAATTRTTQLPIWTAIAARLSYVLGILLAMQVIGSFILYFIMPKFEAIFRDFGQSLPQVTIFVIDASHFLIKYGFFSSAIALVEVGLLIFLPFSFLGWGNYNVPLFDRLFRRRHTALVLRSLALVAEGGRPITLGISTLANHYPTEWVRRRLIRAESDVQDGADWVESLERYGLIRSAEGDVLKSATSVGNLGWALRELAETTERRLATRFQMIVQALFPLAVLALGLLVFIMAMAYFMPLVQLIMGLTRQ